MSFEDELQRFSAEAQRRTTAEAQGRSREEAEAAALSEEQQRSFAEVVAKYVHPARDALLQRDVKREAFLRLTSAGARDRRIPDAGWKMPGNMAITHSGELLLAARSGYRSEQPPPGGRFGGALHVDTWKTQGVLGFSPGEHWTEVYPEPLSPESRSPKGPMDSVLFVTPTYAGTDVYVDPAHWLNQEQPEWCRHFANGKHPYEGYEMYALIPVRYLVLRGVTTLLEGGLNVESLPS